MFREDNEISCRMRRKRISGVEEDKRLKMMMMILEEVEEGIGDHGCTQRRKRKSGDKPTTHTNSNLIHLG